MCSLLGVITIYSNLLHTNILEFENLNQKILQHYEIYQI